MAIKRILARVDGGALDEAVLAYAVQAARRFGAHIDVTHVRFNAADLALATGYGSIVDLASVAEAVHRTADSMAASARRRFDAWVKAHELAAHRPPDGGSASAAWVEAEGPEDQALTRLGRLSDLIVIAQPTEASGAVSLAALETALFETRRPVLMVPDDTRRDLFHNPILAWNASAEAAQALAFAWPFLTASDGLTAVYAAPEDGRENGADDLAAYMRLHGVVAERIAPDSFAESIGADLLAQALRRDCGLLVMGAYTRGRFRQFVFGGVTRHVLRNARLPVLLAR